MISMSHFIKSDIVKVAQKELGIALKDMDGMSYGEIHKQIIKKIPNLHTKKELKELASKLTHQIIEEYNFNAYRIFANYPLIRTKGYNGFQEVYLYEKIHKAMACTTEAFCYLHNIEHDIDKAILEHEFSEIYEKKYGFLSHMFDDANELIIIMQMIHRHDFDPIFVKTIEPDLEISLIRAGDKFFHKNLNDLNTIKQLYQIVGEIYGFDGYRFDIFHDYDGYGNVILNL